MTLLHCKNVIIGIHMKISISYYNYFFHFKSYLRIIYEGILVYNEMIVYFKITYCKVLCRHYKSFSLYCLLKDPAQKEKSSSFLSEWNKFDLPLCINIKREKFVKYVLLFKNTMCIYTRLIFIHIRTDFRDLLYITF